MNMSIVKATMPPKKTTVPARYRHTTTYMPASGPCHPTKKPCPKPFVCDDVTGACVRGRTVEGIAVVRRDKTRLREGRRPGPSLTPWDPTKVPGTLGFNMYVSEYLRENRRAMGTMRIACSTKATPDPYAYQKVLRVLVRPDTTIDRMLVAHRVGAGKTRTFIGVLDNFFHDPRPKVLIFPAETIVNEFYKELMRYPSKYRTYCVRQLGRVPDVKRDLKLIKDTLGWSGAPGRRAAPGEMGAALRAFSYTKAGGSAAYGSSADSLFKYPDPSAKNPYDNKVVVMDEYHNLYSPRSVPGERSYAANLRRLREGLRTAKNSVIVGATATPVDTKHDASVVLREIKGDKYKGSRTNEGFVSYFQELTPGIYPRVLPGPPNRVFPHIHRVPIAGANLTKYREKMRALKGAPTDKDMARMQNYANMANHHAAVRHIRAKLGKYPYSYATKLAFVAQSLLAQRDLKTLVLMSNATGLSALIEIMDHMMRAERRGGGSTCFKHCWFVLEDKPKKSGTDVELLERFSEDDNARGKHLRVAVANARFYSEGVNFKSVRRLVLVDVPHTYQSYDQQVGRVLRSCAHHTQLADTPGEWTVKMDMYVAVEPGAARDTPDEYFLKKLHSDRIALRSQMDVLHDVAVDRVTLQPLLDASGTASEPAQVVTEHTLPPGSVPDERTATELRRECKANGVEAYSGKSVEWLRKHCDGKHPVALGDLDDKDLRRACAKHGKGAVARGKSRAWLEANCTHADAKVSLSGMTEAQQRTYVRGLCRARGITEAQMRGKTLDELVRACYEGTGTPLVAAAAAPRQRTVGELRKLLAGAPGPKLRGVSRMRRDELVAHLRARGVAVE